MSTDPYHAVQAEIQTSLQAATQLRASYMRIRNMNSMRGTTEESEELVWARNEFKATLAALEADLEDLDESVKVVEAASDTRLFGVSFEQVQERRRYVERVRGEIEGMRADVSPSGSRPNSQIMSPRPTPREDEQSAWAREEQQMLMQQQDMTMDSIAGTLSNLAQQAGLMGQEISEHNEMLTDLESGVDSTETKLDSAMTKMRRFVRQTEQSGSGWCITILTIVLIILLVVAILI
ncbi:t-SNARE [Mucidula mucida]|nr:t-SNARE [Mucidula mucida]KAF8874402.1 t-SNARE [Mucidula mucida]